VQLPGRKRGGGRGSSTGRRLGEVHKVGGAGGGELLLFPSPSLAGGRGGAENWKPPGGGKFHIKAEISGYFFVLCSEVRVRKGDDRIPLNAGFLYSTLIKKKNFFIYKEIQSGADAKSNTV
jgi:hypothetical protein